MNYLLIGLNILSGAIIFFYAACQLARRKWKWRHPELVAHALLAGSAVYLIGGVFNGHIIFAEVMMNAAFALFLANKQLRLWHIQHRKNQP